MTLTAGQRLFQKFAVASFISIFLLIVVGGTVRITGSGMGCPDWPRCFGRMIPPTDVSQLPPDYQEIYKDHGYDSMKFNALKTWIEYINRLWTGLVSIVTIGMVITSFSWWKQDKVFSALSLAVIFLIGFEAWLGALVVNTNLNNYKITFHLVAAIFIMMLSIIAIVRLMKYKRGNMPKANNSAVNAMLVFSLLLLFVQVIIGTFVRTEFDMISRHIDAEFRSEWVNYAQTYLPSHRTFSLVVAVVCLLTIIRILVNKNSDSILKISAYVLLFSLVGQMLTGGLLNSAGFPAAAQLLHLVLAMTMIAALFFGLAFNWTRVDLSVLSGTKQVHLA